MSETAAVEVGTLPAPAPQPATMPGSRGGTLRRGNPGNKGRPKSALARQILEAATPEAARILKHMALKGTSPGERPGEVGPPLVLQDRLKALTALLDRGGAPVRTEITGADGGAFVVAVRAANSGDD